MCGTALTTGGAQRTILPVAHETLFMTSTRHALPTVFVLTLLTLGGCGKPEIKPNFTAMTARLSGDHEVPAVRTAGTGTVDATLSPVTLVLAWNVSFSGLSGPVTGAHFHGPAVGGEIAGVVVPINGALLSPITGSAVLTASQAAELNAGKWYLNLHTAAYPNGEVRGQVSLRH